VDTSATVARPIRSRLFRLLGAFGVTSALSLGAIGPLTYQGEADAALNARRRVIVLINARRVDAGLAPLVFNRPIHRAAQVHSRDQAAMGVMTHTGSDGSNAGQRIRREGYRWSAWGENVAMGYPSPRSVVRAWMRSAGHRANILNPAFRHVGVGLRRAADGTLYWTLDFGRPG
jgi:uncharacterized protein YkwD